ncbi:Leucine aminopeptidase A like protein [Verticillium longisporum]|nr:Leucine aminopeptidase A like protein [Verticillium longisporum]
MFHPASRTVAFTPWAHIANTTAPLFLGPYAGMLHHAMPVYNLEQFARLVGSVQATSFQGVPSVVLALADSDVTAKYDFSAARVTAVGGAPLKQAQLEKLLARAPWRLCQAYGMTEAAGYVAYQEYDEVLHDGCTGKLLPGIEACLKQEGGVEDVPDGATGVLWLRGSNISRGYAFNAEANERAFPMPGWYNTGDVCRIGEEGRVSIVGRTKDLIKYKGFQVSPAELEVYVNSHPLVAEGGVGALWDDGQLTEFARSMGVYDRKRAIHDMAKNEDVDVITGDWMSECNMTLRGSNKRDRLAQEKMSSGSTVVAKGYEPYFLDELDPAIPHLASRGIKIAVNAGASDAHGLALAVKELIMKHGVDLKIGVVDGDDVTDAVLDLYQKGETFSNLPANKPIQEWGFDPVCAQCYLGGTGIAECFRNGADIVLCGRVADASVTVGAAMWWHGWTRENLTELAGALMIGHIIECSTYATGGYYSGFKDLKGEDTDMEYPIAAIDEKGEAIITMEKGKHGLVNTQTVASQLLYEIQGPLYYNSDVTASIEDMHLQEIGEHAVHVSGVKGVPPPSTTKVGITAKGGWQAEFHFYLTGLDIAEKAAMVERQTKALMGDHIKRFSCLKFMVAGNVPSDPQSQEEATVDMRIFAQTRDPDLLSGNNFVDSDRGSFARFCIENLLQGYPGSTMAPDMRTAIGRPFFEYWVSLLPQSFVNETAHLPDGRVLDIPSPVVTREYAREQPSYETDSPANLKKVGPTTRGPIGWVVMGRSGDKSSNCNLGLFVRHDDEWDWLRTIMGTKQLRSMLGKDDVGNQIDRCTRIIIMYSAMIFGIAAAVFVAPKSTLASPTSSGQDARVQLGPCDLRHLNAAARARIFRPNRSFFDLTDLIDPPLADLQYMDQDYPTKMVQQRETQNLIRGIDMERIANNMEALVTFQNRHYQSKHGVAASDWIYQEMKRLPGVTKLGRFRHSWPQNSIEMQVSEGRIKKRKTVIVGAHLDVSNKFVVESERDTARAPGANSNASGVVVLLEALNLLLRHHKLSDLKNRVVFQFYAAGDAGLKGSLDIFQQYKNQNISVAAMLNQDMAGSFLSEQAPTDYFNIVSTGTYEPLNGFLKRYCSISWVEIEGGFVSSDHAAATKYGYPAAHVSDSAFAQNPWKGSELDTLDKIRIGHLVEHVKLVLGYVLELGFADL